MTDSERNCVQDVIDRLRGETWYQILHDDGVLIHVNDGTINWRNAHLDDREYRCSYSLEDIAEQVKIGSILRVR